MGIMYGVNGDFCSIKYRPNVLYKIYNKFTINMLSATNVVSHFSHAEDHRLQYKHKLQDTKGLYVNKGSRTPKPTVK